MVGNNWLCAAISLAISLCPRHQMAHSFSPCPSVALYPSLHKWHNLQVLRTPSKIHSGNSDEKLIKSLLDPSSSSDDEDPFSKYTHQIAIPLGEVSELHSALHAIQTSLVRDCPRLVRACIMPALLRMPLLYVDASSYQENSNGSTIFGGGVVYDMDAKFDALLQEVVHNAIRRVVYGEDSGEQNGHHVVEPILLPFQSLELQGDDNSVLYAVGENVNAPRSGKKKMVDDEFDDDETYVVDDWSNESLEKPTGPSGWETLEKIVHAIQDDLESNYNLDTCWPLDAPQGEEIDNDDGDPMIAAVKEKQKKWRPRVPFVRLPKDFFQDLESDTTKRNSSDGGEDEESPSTIEMGFDGISPLFWYETWGEGETDILPAPGVRMRSIAVYRRMVPGGGEAESSFYVPSSTSSKGPLNWRSGVNVESGERTNGNQFSMHLPTGDTKLASRERRETAKAMDRLGEVEQRAEREWEEGKARWIDEMNKPMDSEERSSSFDEFDVGMEVGDITVEGDAAYTSPWSERDSDNRTSFENEQMQITPTEKEEAKNNDRPAEILQGYLNTKPKRDLPSIDDNPVFQRFRKGQPQITRQGQNSAVALEGTPPNDEAPLPPYPSDPHFVGAWRVVSSPMGGEESPILEDTQSQSSNNFIFRVDGQVMGGPVLDAQYQQKAAGGFWKMFQAVRRQTPDLDEDEPQPPAVQTRLQIRLLIPPEKDRALVMEGEVTRLVMSGASEGSTDGSWSMPNGGVLDGMLQNLNEGSKQSEEGSTEEGLLYCAGEAWLEDVNGGTNRSKLGPFSLMKLKSISRQNLIYTVDVSRPKVDREGEDNHDSAPYD